MRNFYASMLHFTYRLTSPLKILNKKVLTGISLIPILKMPDWADTNKIFSFTEKKQNFFILKLLTSYIWLSILNHKLM